MTEQERDRQQGAEASDQDTGADKQSGDGQPVAGAVKESAGKAKDAIESVAQDPSAGMKTVLREAGKIIGNEVKAGLTQAATETVAPAARQAASSALVYVATKGPGMVEGAVKDTIAPKLKEAGGAQAVAGMVLGKFPGMATKLLPKALGKLPGAGAMGSLLGKAGGGGGGGGGGDGGDELKGVGRGRRLPLQAAIDVSVPVEVAYDQWTQFEEFPKFMFRVERIEQKDETHLIWHEKIWGIRRQWEAEIVEQRPNERIVWRSTSGPQNVGVVNFHQLHDPRLSRVQVNLDFEPTGLIEKTGRGWRAAIRALDTDLQRFKAFIEMKDTATGAWRGRIKDAEVQPEEQGEQPEGEQPEGEQAEAAESGDTQAGAAAESEQGEGEAQQGESEQAQAGAAQAPEGEAEQGEDRAPEAEAEDRAAEDEPAKGSAEADDSEDGEPVVAGKRQERAGRPA
jgi:uncharacterized membrane protein/ubiquitin